MDLLDATRIFMSESAAEPEVLRIAQFIHDKLFLGQPVPYRELRGLAGRV